MWCPQCNEYRRATNPSVTHVLHAALSVVTLGIWLLAWMWAQGGRNFHCDSCGTVTTPTKLEDA